MATDPKLPTPIIPFDGDPPVGPVSGLMPPPPLVEFPPVGDGPDPTAPDFKFYEAYKTDDGTWHAEPRPTEDRQVTGVDGKPTILPGLKSKLKKQIDEEAAKRIAEIAPQDRQMAVLLALANLGRKINLSASEQQQLSEANNLVAKLDAIRNYAAAAHQSIDNLTFDEITHWTMPYTWPTP